MSNLPVLFLPFILAATRSLTLGARAPGKLGNRTVTPAEKEYEFLALVTFCLLGSLVVLNVMVRFPNCGTVIAEYNQF